MMPTTKNEVAVDMTDALKERIDGLAAQIEETLNLRMRAIDDQFGVVSAEGWDALTKERQIEFVALRKAELYATAVVLGAFSRVVALSMDESTRAQAAQFTMGYSKRLEPPIDTRSLRVYAQRPPCSCPACMKERS